MSANDVFMLVVRWLHVTASAAWVGGSIFYLVALRPALRKSGEGGRIVNRYTAAEFRVLVDICFFIIVVTGVSLTFDRLEGSAAGPVYVAVLALKAALSVWMFLLARRRRRDATLEAYRQRPKPPTSRLGRAIRAISGYNTVVILGVAIFLLADLLNELYEMALS